MGIGNSLVSFGIPVRIILLFNPEVLAGPDKSLPQLKGMLIPVPEDIKRPVVGSALIAIDDMNSNFQFRFVGNIFAGLYYFSI